MVAAQNCVAKRSVAVDGAKSNAGLCDDASIFSNASTREPDDYLNAVVRSLPRGSSSSSPANLSASQSFSADSSGAESETLTTQAPTPRSNAPAAASSDARRKKIEQEPVCAQFIRVNKSAPQREYSVGEVRRHCTADDCWVIVEGKVYNVTGWLQRHPAGEIIILNVAGMDITDAFLVNHLPWVRERLLPLYQIGCVKQDKQSQSVSLIARDFRRLAQWFEAEGWYKTSYLYYTQMLLWYLFLFVTSIWCVMYGTSFFVRSLLGAALMAIFWQQIAFLGHDLGHMAVFHDRVLDNLCGVIGGNLLMGIALGWWKATHNVHHLVTNYHEYDPDIQHLPVLAVSRKFFAGIYSFYHKRRFEFDAISQQIVRRQHLLFYPIMFLARFNLYLQSILLLLHPRDAIKRGVTYPRLELAMLMGFYAWFSRLISYLPTWTEFFVFLFLSHGLAGILHLQICLSHFPMEVLDQKADGLPLEKLEFVPQQLRTSLDVDCHPWLDWFHGGLQFQTTHHLYPLLPRHRLREAMDIVEKLCEKHGLKYNKLRFFNANALILKTLKNTADGIHPWLHSLAMCEG